MKFSKFAFLAAGALLATSCSSEINEPDVPEVGNLETGYVQLELNLPTEELGTRATENYEFVGGTEDEWAVKNGKVIIWTKETKEADAKFVCLAELNGFDSKEDKDNSEIEATLTAKAHLSNIDMVGKTEYYATVVLNYNSSFEFPNPGGELNTFGKWSEHAQTNSMTIVDGSKTYLTMSQAPKFNNETKTPTHLVAIDKSKIAQTESGASEAAGSFNVQRGVAKVIVKGGKFDVKGSNFAGDNVNITAWGLDITNTKTYPVQVTEGIAVDYSGDWSARFLGEFQSNFRRIFWAKDPNYNMDFDKLDAVKAEFNRVTTVNSAPAAMYCLENTFDINHQLQGQTTRVVLHGTYTPNSIPGYTQGATFFRIGTSNKLWLNTALSQEIKSHAMTLLNATSVDVNMTNFGPAGYHSFSEITIKNGTQEISDTDYDKIAQSFGLKDRNDKAVATYQNGNCYYVARVKHFGDKETPWTVGQPTYNGDNSKWLGRYGIVRNHIYEVVVTSVSNPGSPCVPEVNPTDPDDVNDYYIQAKINILPWAKRVNNVDL